jgi:hypothetical protein
MRARQAHQQALDAINPSVFGERLSGTEVVSGHIWRIVVIKRVFRRIQKYLHKAYLENK